MGGLGLPFFYRAFSFSIRVSDRRRIVTAVPATMIQSVTVRVHSRGVERGEDGADGQDRHALRFGEGAGEIGREALGPAKLTHVGGGDGEGGGEARRGRGCRQRSRHRSGREGPTGGPVPRSRRGRPWCPARLRPRPCRRSGCRPAGPGWWRRRGAARGPAERPGPKGESA